VQAKDWSRRYSGAYTEDYAANQDPRGYVRVTPFDVGLQRPQAPRIQQPPVTQPQEVGKTREPSTVETLLLELINLQRRQLGAAPVALPPISSSDIRRVQVEDNQRYGFVTHQSKVLDAENDGFDDTIVLLKPATQRIYLLVQNNASVASIVVAFGSVASTANGILLTAGGNLEMSSFVAQDDVHLFCQAAQTGTPGTSANILISYCNK